MYDKYLFIQTFEKNGARVISSTSMRLLTKVNFNAALQFFLIRSQYVALQEIDIESDGLAKI